MDAKKVKRIRKRLGLSQQKFADAIGASLRSVVNWEAGRHPMHRVYERQILELAKQKRGAA
jgi:DNA-binding transcriptional regulator YiaG